MLTDADLIAVERELCRRSLAEFAKLAWPVLEPGAALKWGWALDAICQHLQAVTDGKINRLLINVPPGSMKSLLAGVIWPAWEWGPRDMQEMRYVGTAHEEGLAIRDSRKCRDLIKSEWYQKLWPVRLAADLDGKREFGNVRKGVRQARSFSSMTGVRGDRVIIDDPHSVDDANSAVKLAADVTTFREALPTRVNSEKSAIVIIMQRLNAADISAVAIELGYVHLCIPMRFEVDRRCTTAIGWTDPRTDDGELMFPDRFSEAQVSELEKTLGSYATAGQLQQRPTQRGGGIIKLPWFRYWQQTPPALEFRFITVDTAQKTGEQNDWSVLQCWGRSTTGQAVLIDQVRGKWESPELLQNARSFWHKQRHDNRPTCAQGQLRAMHIEDKSSGIGLVQTLRREGVPVVPIPRRRDKISRAHDVSPFVESGNVVLPEYATWITDLMPEIEAFPAGAHDDQVDAMLDGLHIVQNSPAMVVQSTAAPIPIRNHW